jgi:hypothetical protein
VVKRGNSKKGLSTIIATLLMILLTIVAIVILWVVLRNITLQKSEVVDTQKDFLKENIYISSLRVDGSFVDIHLMKTTGGLGVETTQTGNNSGGISDMDVISVIDVSGSMCACDSVPSDCCRNVLGGDYSGGNCHGLSSNQNDSCITTCGGTWVDRLSYAKEANKELISIISQEETNRIGLVVYSTNVNDSAGSDLTDDITFLNEKIDSWQANGSTCICCGINQAARQLEEQSSDGRIKKVIVMSDGEANVQCPLQNTHDAMQDAIKSSCDARANPNLPNLTIYSVGAGENVNEGTLINISICGGGKYFSAFNVSELAEIYRILAEDIKTSYKSKSNLDYLYLIFYNGTDSYKEKILDIPDPLVIRGYEYNMTGKLEGKITKIELYPVIVTDSGKEVVGPLYDSWIAP